MTHATTDKRTYLVVFGLLLALLVLTLACAYLPAGWLTTTIGFAIATAKAVLIILYFMHVRESGGLVKVFVGAGFLWLLLLVSGTLHDVLTRGWVSQP
jgi:cytochrome c oxidase subunit 4